MGSLNVLIEVAEEQIKQCIYNKLARTFIQACNIYRCNKQALQEKI